MTDNTLLLRTIAPLRRRLILLYPSHAQALSALEDHQRILDSLKRHNQIDAISIFK